MSIQGFSVNVYYNSDLGTGIHGFGNNHITENKITNGIIGIYSGLNSLIKKNYVLGNRIGIYVDNSNAIVINNYIYHSTYSGSNGIQIGASDFTYTPLIISNYIETISLGIVKSFGSNPTITNNTIILNRISARGIYLSYSDSSKVYNNCIFSRIGYEAIRNNSIPYLVLNNNYIAGNFYDNVNAWAIQVGPGNTVKNNVVTNAVRGVYNAGTIDPEFKYNNIWDTQIKYKNFVGDSTNLSVDPMIVNDDSTQGEFDFIYRNILL